MKGKVFASSDNIYQDQAKILFNYYQQAAEKIVREEERIEAFVAEHKANTAYPNKDLYDWHHRLTGSCDMGRKAFVADHGLTMDGETTVEEFIRLTENAYGGSTIKKLRSYYPIKTKE